CVLDPRADLGVGEVHFPELLTDGGGDVHKANAILRDRCGTGLSRRAMTLTPQVQQRLDDELDVIAQLGYPTYFLTIADVVQLVKDRASAGAPRAAGRGVPATSRFWSSMAAPLDHACWSGRFPPHRARGCPASAS